MEFSCFSTCTTSPSPSSHSLHTKSREIRQQSAMATVSYPLSHNTQDSSAAHAYFSVNSSSFIWPSPPPPPTHSPPHTPPLEEMCELFTGLLNQSSHGAAGAGGWSKLAQLSLATSSRASPPPSPPSLLYPRGTTKFLTSATCKCFQRRTSC